MKPVARGVLCGVLMLLAAPTGAQPEADTGSSVLTGTVIDSESRLPVPEVMVVATSSALPEGRGVVTDGRGNYRHSRLPPGLYTLRFVREEYVPRVRADLRLRERRTLRVTAELLRGEGQAMARGPITDVGAASPSVNVDAEFLRRIAMARPTRADDERCHGGSISGVASAPDAPTEEGGAPPGRDAGREEFMMKR
ncbi:carboxypeptidase-like regulatory domain-containing protein [Pyxidicoccus xibeiensis]|uniref:carboxypeptidase-like regulatory domain-containing protein n=1 Tax=Pyxidicoccus xibeiensis TaxID=2906759 RepID=UPI0020A82EC9|nr:carboxypeptidase-like regulatory domain-containing protein [Pyxidicoccus xibeiensis]MCP3137190.1 carboxypeptidase-like regulatory domain-containing protein [Pyxidicoccus xibeiensis]